MAVWFILNGTWNAKKEILVPRLWSDLGPGGHMSNSSRRALYWAPRALSILYILFLSMFALDVFSEGRGFFSAWLGALAVCGAMVQ